MAAEPPTVSRLEVGHVLFLDIVGYSKLLSDKQRKVFQLLKDIVRDTSQFRSAEAANKLVRIPTGDGMVLAFFTNVDAPVRCALEISRKLREHPELKLRMGINSGPVDQVSDVNEQRNITGVGINMAQRLMDCGDAGHILLSRRVADDLAQYSEWKSHLHELGQLEVKHGAKIDVVNFYNDEVGNAEVPEKFKQAREQIARADRLVATRRRKRIILSAALFVAIASGIGLRTFFRWSSLRIAALPISDKSIAVLPFENLSDERENAYFADGVQNEILTDLAKVADLKVISRTSVMAYKAGNPRNLREIAQQLGVAHVLEGNVQRAGGKVRVNAQLIDARTDKHLWAQSYDRALADVFAIETEVAQAIANELQAKLSASEKAAIEQRPTQDLVAYDFYVRAVSMIYNAQVPDESLGLDTEKSLSEAVDLLNKAVARDPNFFLAYCQLAFAHDLIGDTPERLALAKSAIDSAFWLRPDSGEAHLALAWHLYWGYLDYDRARAELARAQQSLPNNPRVYELAGSMDRSQRRWVDATHNLERACELDPRNFPYLVNLGSTYLWLHDYDQHAKIMDRIVALLPERRRERIFRASVEVYRRADTGPWRAEIEKILTNEAGSEKDPFMAGQRYTLALYDRDWDTASSLAPVLSQKNSLEWSFPQLGRDFWVGVVARLKGDETSARAAFIKARAQQKEEIRGHPDDVTLLADLGLIDAGLGRKEEALNEGRRAMELGSSVKDSGTEPYVKMCFAMICAWTGEAELALGQLEASATSPGYHTYGNLRLSPLWDPLRGDPRFEKIVASLAPKK
jgi:TolB-like protein/Tfp pilus assembly protein PilF